MLPRVVSSGSLEKYIDADAVDQYLKGDGGFSRVASHASFCSLADLPLYGFDATQLQTLLEPHASRGLGTIWEAGCYLAPRRPDSATSNSLCSRNDNDAMSEDNIEMNVSVAAALPAPFSDLGMDMDAPYVVYDTGGESYLTPQVQSPQSIFQAGRWY